MSSLAPSLEVITGPMYSGKSEELIRRLNRARIARLGLLIFRPMRDTRYHDTSVASQTGSTFPAIPVRDARHMLDTTMERLGSGFDVVAIDEAQFFDKEIIKFVNWMLCRGKKVIIAGLDTDFRGIPFEHIPYLMAIADSVTKLSAICTVCGKDANHTYRKGDSQELFVVGSTDLYEARCRICFKLEA